MSDSPSKEEKQEAAGSNEAAAKEEGADCPWVISATDETFQKDVVDRSSELPVVVDFWAAWCGPCRTLGPMLEKLAAEGEGKFLLAKVDVEASPNSAAGYQVQSIPAVFGLRDGQVVDYFTGVLPEEQLQRWLEGIQPSALERLLAEASNLAVADPASAEAKYREAMTLDARRHEAKIALARLLLDQDRLEDCHVLVEELAGRGFMEPEAEVVQSQLALRRDAAAAGSVESCAAAADASPDSLDLQMKQAQALAGAEQYQAAMDVCLRLLQQDRKGLGETAREMMVRIFHVLGAESELAGEYRRKLSAVLY